MDLVAIYDWVPVFMRRHKRNEPHHLAVVLHQEVLEVQQLHLFLLGRWLPALHGLLVVLGAAELDQAEARIEVSV